MSDEKFYRVVEKRGKAVIVGLDNKPLSPTEAKRLAEVVVETAEGKAHVYIGFRESDGLHKIGRTEHLEDRSKRLGIEYVHLIECDLYGECSSSAIESLVHNFFEDDCVEGEWFRLTAADTTLLKIFCHTGLDTRAFFDEFIPILKGVRQEMAETNEARVLADMLEFPIYQTKIRTRAIYYAIHKASLSNIHIEHVGNARYCEALIDLMNTMFWIQADPLRSGYELAEQYRSGRSGQRLKP